LLGEAEGAVAVMDADVGAAAVVADVLVADRAEIFPLTLAETQVTFGTAMTSLI
jgi:hypothetical protein